MFPSCARALSCRKIHNRYRDFNRISNFLLNCNKDSTPTSYLCQASFISSPNTRSFVDGFKINAHQATSWGPNQFKLSSKSCIIDLRCKAGFCTSPSQINANLETEEVSIDSSNSACSSDPKVQLTCDNPIEFSKVDANMLPTVLLIGRPNVGKSALFNRLIRRREALVYNTPNDHVTRDIREGIAKLSDLRFRVLDSAGLEAEASSGSVLGRTAGMTENVLKRSQLALFLIDARDGLQPMDLDVGKWLRKNAPELKIIVLMNKAESLDDGLGSLAAASGEALRLGFGDPIALSAETGQGMVELYEALRPLLEDYMVQLLNGDVFYHRIMKYYINLIKINHGKDISKDNRALIS